MEKASVNICDKVRQSCFDWMGEEFDPVDCNNSSSRSNSSSCCFGRGKKYVCIHTDKLQEAVTSSTRLLDQNKKVTWDEEDWHYQPPMTWPQAIRNERIALYILALDAINFCFWPAAAAGYEYDNLACTLTAMVQADHVQQETDLSRISKDYVFLPRNLKDLTVDKMQALFCLQQQKQFHQNDNDDNDDAALLAGGGDFSSFLVPPDLDRRCALWNEVGCVLLEKFNGSAMTLIHSANESAVQLVQLIYDNFPGFRDQVDFFAAVDSNHDDDDDDGIGVGEKQDDKTATTTTTIFFLKRAQICVGDLHAALKLQKEEEKEGNQSDGRATTSCTTTTTNNTATTTTDAWSDMNQLTTFADYRLPQLLRHWQVLEYCDTALQEAVDGKLELQPGSDEEISIRAATVVCVEKLVSILNNLQQQQQQQQQQTKQDAQELPLTTTTWTAVQVDWYLWQVGERMDSQGELQPHHRVRTIYY